MADTDKRTQRQKFIDKARELGCDEDEDAFKRKLRRIAKAGPAKEPKKAETDKSD